MKQKTKKIMAIVLSLTLVVGVVSIFAPKNTTTTAMAKQKTVYDEIKLSKLSDKKLENVAKTALDDGAKAAKEVNSYKDEADYNAALNSAMASYYKKNDKKQLKSFTKNLDKRAKSTVAGYEKAAKERTKGVKNGFIPGEVIAIFDKEVSKKEIKDVCKSQNATLKKCFKIHTDEYMAVIKISLGDTVDAASKKFSKLSFIQAADSNDLGKPSDLKTDIVSKTRSYINDPVMDYAYHFDDMHVKGAWDYLKNHEHRKVKVGVIDLGCYYDNPDIAECITDDSYDVIAQKPIREVSYSSEQYHGTAVMGTIAAKSNNGRMVAGVASGYDNDIVDILAIQAATYYESLNDYRFPWEKVYEALEYAVEHGAEVINMSLGSQGKNSTMDTYLKKVYGAGVVVFVSAGNDNISGDYYPSDSPYVISVGATDDRHIKAEFSCYGKQKDICAPGKSIPCLYYGNTVTYMQGTSFSAPAATAVGAMMLSLNANLDTFDIMRIMQNTDTFLPSLDSRQKFKHGIVNAEKCVKVADGYKTSDTFDVEEENFVNVADKASITISSDSNPQYVNNLVDEDFTTSTTISAGENRTIILELDKEYDVYAVESFIPEAIEGGLRFDISLDGINYSSLYSDPSGLLRGSFMSPISRDEAETRRTKYVKLTFRNCTEAFQLGEIAVWAKGSIKRPADKCETEEIVATPQNLEAEYLGNREVKLKWNVTNKMVAKNYQFKIYTRGVLVGWTSDNSIVITDIVNDNNAVYEIRAEYNGKLSDYNSIEKYIDWNQGATTTQPPTQSPSVNLALGKPAYASSEENGGVTAGKAVDGDENTRWSSAFTDDEWIYVDLGKICTVSRMEIKWETARAAVYDTYLSIDGVNWTKYASNGQNAENTTDYLGNRYARYVKIQGVRRNTGYGYSIFEWKIFGSEGDQTTAAPTTTKAPTTVAPTTSAESTTAQETTTRTTRRIITSGYTISTENVAAGKTAFASSEENAGVNADKVCDGDMGTRWSSQWTDDEWIVVDLGQVMPIALVKLHWEAAYGKDYVVQFSEDGNKYYDKRTTTNNTLRDTIEAFPAEYTRYIRVKCSQRATNYGYSLFEIEAFPAIINGATTTVAPTTTTAQQFTNLALGKNATASTYENDSMSAVKAFDGDMGTRWASAWADNQFIRVNLESQRYINHIVINWEAAYGKDYEIQLSNDGKIWNTKKTITNSDGGIDTVPVNDSAQFVRLVCVTRGTNYGFSIYEMAVMGY